MASSQRDPFANRSRLKALQQRLEEAEATLEAIRSGAADAIVVQTASGVSVYTIQGAETAYRIMVETMSEGALTMDGEGVILYSNTRFCAMLGIDCPALVGTLLVSHIAAHQRHDFAQFLGQTTAGQNVHRDFELITGSGATLPVYFSSARLQIEERCDICIVATDLTERMNARQKLMELNDSLEQKVLERTRQLEARTGELEKSRHQLQQLTQSLEQQVERRTGQVRDLARELTLAEQKQRQRLSLILHEDLQQVLLSVRARFELLKNTIASGLEEQITEDLGELERLLLRALDTTKRLALEFNPPVLANEGLDAALRWLADHFHRRYGLTIEVSIAESFKLMREEERVLLVQLVRELLLNVVRHAGTNRASLTVESEGNHIVIAVEDQGAGFDPARLRQGARAPNQIGLFSIEERLRLFGGSLRIESSPGRGTRICMLVPFNPASRQLSVE